MPSGEHQREIKILSLDARRHPESRFRQRPEIRPESLHEMQVRPKTFGKPEAGFRAQKKHAPAAGCFEIAGLERMEQGGERS